VEPAGYRPPPTVYLLVGTYLTVFTFAREDFYLGETFGLGLYAGFENGMS